MLIEVCLFLFQPFLIIADLTKEADTKNVLESTVKHFGKLDILVRPNFKDQNV